MKLLKELWQIKKLLDIEATNLLYLYPQEYILFKHLPAIHSKELCSFYLTKKIPELISFGNILYLFWFRCSTLMEFQEDIAGWTL